MKRPFSLRWTRYGPRLVWVERRRQRGPAELPSSAQVSVELEIALLAHPDAAAAMPHLVRVHDQLVLKGWPGLAVLPSELIQKALAQGRVVAAGADAPALAALLEHLRQLNAHLPEAGADRRSLEDTVPTRDGAARVEVSELGEADFEQLAREWGHSQDAAPAPPAPAAGGQAPPPLH
ncbi:MAG: hypothetical protein HY020_26730 [Burkholderiales bacterium]|nr:hypothetical protein [Burkholderiales bacterium]